MARASALAVPDPACADFETCLSLSMIPKKPAPDLIRGGNRFSEKIVLKQKDKRCS
jgi:hypothetical protein